MNLGQIKTLLQMRTMDVMLFLGFIETDAKMGF
jgi:hypothetical protein